MWLTGLTEGFNKGGNVDSFDRYIYIHGTHEEGLIGKKSITWMHQDAES
jgi:hypothetical protein